MNSAASNRLADLNLNVRYIAVDDVEVTGTLDNPAMNTKVDEEALGPEGVVNKEGAYIDQTAVRQLLWECAQNLICRAHVQGGVLQKHQISY